MTETTEDLVKRLRRVSMDLGIPSTTTLDSKVVAQAVDRIEALERILGLADDQRREWEHHCKEAENKLAKAVEALRFYADEENYRGQSYVEECGCCSSWFEPKIHIDGEDSGDLARATLAKLTGGKDD